MGSILAGPGAFSGRITPAAPFAQPNSVGSKFTFNWSYDLFNRRKANVFSCDMAIEDRRPLGTNLPPSQASIGAGSIVPNAATWGMFDLGITQA
jgi:porin